MRLLRGLLLTSATTLAGCEPFFGAPAKITTITIEPAEITLAEFESAPIKAVVRDSRGDTMPGVTVYWASRDYSVAMVDEFMHTVQGGLPGTTIIDAHAGDKVATARVVVTRAPIKTLVTYPTRFAIVPGQQVQLNFRAEDANHRTLLDRSATFSSENEFATVTSFGLVTGIAPGFAAITVTVDGVSSEVRLRVVPPGMSFDFYKRGGTTTPGTATLTFAPQDINRATLSIDGKTVPVITAPSYDWGVTCMQVVANASPDALTRCAYDASPFTMRLCTSVGGATDPGQLQYVLLPTTDTNRVAATASELLSAVQANTKLQGINVHTGCISGFAPPGATSPPRWVRNAPDTDFFLWPDVKTIYPSASVAALLDGAVIYRANPAVTASLYVAIRVSSTVFEVWH